MVLVTSVKNKVPEEADGNLIISAWANMLTHILFSSFEVKPRLNLDLDPPLEIASLRSYIAVKMGAKHFFCLHTDSKLVKIAKTLQWCIKAKQSALFIGSHE